MFEVVTARDWLEVPDADHDVDPLLELLIARVSDMITTATGYTYVAEGSVVDYVRGLGTAELFLARNATADPTEVREIAAIGEVGTVITAAQADGWERRDTRLLRKAGGVWTLGVDYKVTYPSGYAAGAAPEAVQMAALRIMAILYNGRGLEGVKSESLADYSFTSAGDDEEIKDIIATLPYRPVFA